VPVLRRAPFAVVLAIQLVISMLLAEGLLLAIYHHPAAWYPAGLRRFLTTEYFNRRDIVQLDERHARYDADLFYTLQPGAFMFENVEFSTQFVVNTLGVRDNQRSLAEPEIVVAGDSYAMGWGVQQDESFPELIERRTGRRVLNAAVSSYGTVREGRLLDRVDLSRTTTLIVQYAPNDFNENDEFLKRGNQYTPSRREEWLAAIAEQRRRGRYWPFRMVYDSVVWIKRGITGWPQGGFEPTHYPPDAAAERFLNALMHASRKDLSALRIIVLDIDEDPAFIRALDRLRQSETYPPYIRGMRVVDLSGRLTPDLHYVLDDHLNARGHAAIADAIIDAIGK
jgi:lysophospholipase L1-like esterase